MALPANGPNSALGKVHEIGKADSVKSAFRYSEYKALVIKVILVMGTVANEHSEVVEAKKKERT